MRYLCLYKPAKAEGVPPTRQEMTEMGNLIEDMTRAGTLLSTEGCQPSSKGARVRMSRGNFTVTDGPFAEAKELIGGLAIIQAESKAEAIELAKRFLKVAGDGETEIRLLHDVSEISVPDSFGDNPGNHQEHTTR